MRLTIYSKPGCHLCDQMKAVVTRTIQNRDAISRDAINIEEIDISSDPALLALYELEIPVLMIEGKKFAKFRVTEAELARKLDGAPR